MSESLAVTVDSVARVLRPRLPWLREVLACERLSGGASQETWRLRVLGPDGAIDLALRRVPGGAAFARNVEQIGPVAEARLLRCASAAGVPVPTVLHELQPGDRLGQGYVMTWLDGETLGARLVRDPSLNDVRPRLAAACGDILARIHAIDVQANGLDEILPSVAPATLVEQVWARYRGFVTPQPMIDYTARWLLDHLPPPVTPRLVHGDFRNGNLMVGPQGIVGVLDWEIAHLGDPVRDLGWLCTNSWRFGVTALPVGGFGTREALCEAYRQASGHAVEPAHLHFWEVFGSFWWAVGCLEMADQYRAGPDVSVERPAIGRRSSECQIDCVNLLIPGPVTAVDATPPSDDQLPRTDELLASVRDFLRQDVSTETLGRTRFLARVAANSLDIVLRERAQGPRTMAGEHVRLRALCGDGDLDALRWRLVERLRDGGLALDDAALIRHLRQTVFDRVMIDQPGYSGAQTARDAATT